MKKEPYGLTSLYCTTAALMDEEQANYLGAINSICTSMTSTSTTTKPKRKNIDVINAYIASQSDEQIQNALKLIKEKEKQKVLLRK